MREFNSVVQVPPHFIRLYAEEIQEDTKRILFKFPYDLQIWINKNNLIAVNAGLFNRTFYINRYKIPHID